MIAAIIPIHKSTKIHECEDLLKQLKDAYQKDIAELEETPRHAISHESMMLAKLNAQLDIIDRIYSNLKTVTEAINAPFVTQTEVDSKISASQPYNPGSRENY